MTSPNGAGRMTDEQQDLREVMRRQMLASIGGWSGALITAVPTAVFIIVDVLTSLRVAVIAAVGTALVFTVYRLVRRQPVLQALSGLVGVALAALIAAVTGQARAFFLIGIWTSFLYSVPFAVSLVLRRPLVGVIWEFIDPIDSSDSDSDTGIDPAADTESGVDIGIHIEQSTRAGRPPVADETVVDAGEAVPTAETIPADVGTRDGAPQWYRRRVLLAAYMWATLIATVVFLSRGIVQLVLYRHDSTGWLAFARIAMGYPLFVVAAGAAFLIVRRARREVQAALA